MSNTFDTRQTIYRGNLTRLAASATPSLSTLLGSLNTEVTPAFSMNCTGTDLVVSVGASTITNTVTGLTHALPTIGTNTPNVAASTITFTYSSGSGSAALTQGNSATFSMSASQYIKALVYLDASDKLNLLFGTPNASSSSANVLQAPSGTLPIGYITLQTSAGNVLQNITTASITQYTFGAGGGASSSGTGVASPATGYGILVSDSFAAITGSTDDTVYHTLTNAAYDAGNKMYKILCDKSKIVATNSGTGLTIATGCSFTVAAGDIVYVTSGTRINQWRKIASVTSQTSFTLDVAFTGGNTTAGDTLMFSQAVHTQDLAAFGDAAQLTRPGDFYSATNILQILIDYSDTLTANDAVGDYNSTPRVVVSASNEGAQFAAGTTTSDKYSAIFTRPVGAAALTDYILTSNSNQQRLFLAFFANPSNASVTATCNLLDYDCNMYTDTQAVNGGVLNSAYGTSDNSTTPYNMTITTSGTTYVDLAWSFNDSADPGGVASQLRVVVNGQDVPKYVSSAVTPSSRINYTLGTDTNGVKRRVTFNTDLSINPVGIKITQQFGVYDASFTQSNKLIGLYDAIVGSTSQVTAGYATYSSLQAAHDAVASGSNILVLNNVTLSADATVTLSKRIMIHGKGPGSVLTGNLVFASGAAGSIVKWMKVIGNVTFNAGADKNFMQECWRNTAGTFTNDASNVDNHISIVVE
jgi:hypothetical protein